ncbi:hypothetical protein IGI04_018706 [Brassica rapa subsp. trilocularis]|uniref:Uncharacterized protein n=1 Tax=Brassica rapa subsp. trilocularis TaxID=1813537 RepID=A0ABQ7MDQ4_BRACM|nr:hypothetical protein IGI04_018706 [Brassica rapa subsp. trilocularis]
MRKLLPDYAFGGRGEKMVLLRVSETRLEEGTAAIASPLRVTNFYDVYESPEDMRKESKR